MANLAEGGIRPRRCALPNCRCCIRPICRAFFESLIIGRRFSFMRDRELYFPGLSGSEGRTLKENGGLGRPGKLGRSMLRPYKRADQSTQYPLRISTPTVLPTS